jgi:uncharacterized protein
LTQQAYNLGQITAKPFTAEENLTFETLEANKATIDNIRLWDWQPLKDTYAQLQEIRTYYKFHDVDVDRYWLDGAYQSVMLSARAGKKPTAMLWFFLLVLSLGLVFEWHVAAVLLVLWLIGYVAFWLFKLFKPVR